jgi:integrase/recombinase XerC
MNTLQTSNNNPTSIQKHAGINEDILNAFISYCQVKESTLKSYMKAIRQFLTFIKINKITHPQRSDVLRFKEHLKTYCKAGTVQTYIVSVRLFFKWTSQEGIYPNIAEHIKGAKIERGYKKDCLSANQIKSVLSVIDRENLKGKRDYALLSLMTTCGLRTIEIVRANVEDLRTSGDSEVLYIQGKGRNNKTEFVKIPTQVGNLLRDYMHALSYTPNATDPLFASVSNHSNGKRMTTRSISRIIKKCFLNTGYDSDRLTAHSLRHTAITLALLGGENLQAVQALARHTNINTTMIYSHNIDRMRSTCENTVANAIFA